MNHICVVHSDAPQDFFLQHLKIADVNWFCQLLVWLLGLEFVAHISFSDSALSLKDLGIRNQLWDYSFSMQPYCDPRATLRRDFFHVKFTFSGDGNDVSLNF